MDRKGGSPCRTVAAPASEHQMNALPEYVQDINAFKTADLNYYWLSLPAGKAWGRTTRRGWRQ
jgi:hypothetical protein